MGRGRGRVLRHTTLASKVLAFVAVWVVLAFVAGTVFFLLSSRSIVLASHDAVIRPDLDGHVVLHTGPVVPDFRVDSGNRLGVDIRLGKTDAASTEALVQRYAYIASQPEGQIAKVKDALADMAYAAALRGAVVGLLPILVWLLLGAQRRRHLLTRTRSPQGALSCLLGVLLVLLVWQPWGSDDDSIDATRSWMPLAQFVGPEVHLPAEVDGVEVRGDVTTTQTRRLIESAISTYDKSKTFYTRAAEQAADLDLRQPGEGETVVALLSDRHDNIGMDKVARAVADTGGATAVFDAGDDTSTGNSWEAFSLDSVTAAFEDLDRWGIAGNHDHGTFVSRYLDEHGWTMLDGTVVPGPAGTTLLGLDDPRSSGLGDWRDESGLSFDEVGSRLADVACAAPERVTTLLVHDADLGQDALERGCVDLVLAGHLHVQVGPVRVVGEGGQVGYSYTNGTTGGAAYAIAVGSKPRREAELTLVTYRDGRPVGVQPVVLQTDGVFHVRDYVPLHLAEDRSTQLAGNRPPAGTSSD
ncbi:metallophosphoesterase family protein [Nocardioides sp. MAHUQ-72]|uniref:metallophosphoesterase family protein n=1 Tax=unclassified Nocardioides TaxID=2615069 RepID=UPI00361A68BD